MPHGPVLYSYLYMGNGKTGIRDTTICSCLLIACFPEDLLECQWPKAVPASLLCIVLPLAWHRKDLRSVLMSLLKLYLATILYSAVCGVFTAKLGVRSGQKNCHSKSEALQMRERLEHGHPPPSFTLLPDLSTESFLFFQEKQQQQQRARKAQSFYMRL